MSTGEQFTLALKMKFHIPGLELVEPLRPRPVFGAAIGGAVGCLFGMLSLGELFAATDVAQVMGYVLGGGVAGVVIGGGQPMFRRRWAAGGMVALAITTGLFIAGRLWRRDVWLRESLLVGVSAGLIYALLLWEYRSTNGQSPSNAGPDQEADV